MLPPSVPPSARLSRKKNGWSNTHSLLPTSCRRTAAYGVPSNDHVIPSAFDRRVAPAVAAAVARAARDEGHVRPGSGGSRREETAAALREAALRAVERGRSARGS